MKFGMKLGLLMALSAISLTGCPNRGGDPGPGLTFVDDSEVFVSIEFEKAEETRPFEIFTTEVLAGPTVPHTSLWVRAAARASNGESAETWVSWVKIIYRTITGTTQNPRIGPVYTDELFLSYDEDGIMTVRDISGNIVASGAGLLQLYVFKEAFETVACFSWNLWVGAPWCFNTPLKNAPPYNPYPWIEWTEQGEPFSMVAAVAQEVAMTKNLSPKSADDRSQLVEMKIDTKWLCSVEMSARYVAQSGDSEEVEFIASTLEMDYDNDGLVNCEEINNGTDPYDPNDPGQNRKVPGLIGKTVGEAQAALAGRDLVLGDVHYAYSSSQPKDRIFQQDPNKGTTVPKGSAVDVVVSKGVEPPNTTTVPNVVGKQLAQAEIDLADASLQTGTVSYAYHPTAPVGQVIGQSPVPGTVVPVASAVNLTVSKGPEPPETTTVPNVVGKTVAEATTLLTAADLVLGTVSEAYHPTVPAGKIISQNPTSGNVVAVGSAVNVVVSKGPEPVNPLTASFTSPIDGSAFVSGNLVTFKMNIVNGVPPFTTRILVETGPVPGWQEIETMSRTPQWSMNLNSTAEPGPTYAHAYGWVKDSLGEETAVFSVSYTVD